LKGADLVLEDAHKAEDKPLVVMITGVAPAAPNIAGCLAKSWSDQHRIWMVCVRSENATPVTVSRLVALAILDDNQQLITPDALRLRPGTAILFSNNEFRLGRSRTLAPWAVWEVGRLAAILIAEHSGYLTAMCAELRGERRPGFGPLPIDFIYADTEGWARRAPNPPMLDADVSRSDRSRGLETWQVAANDYRRDRYLAHLTSEQIRRRIQDVMGNLHEVSDKGLIALRNDPAARAWLLMLGDCNVEMSLRHGDGWRDVGFQKNEWVGSLNSAALAKGLQLRTPPASPLNYFVKYGEREHLEAALRHGKLRIAPASKYGDSSLNRAIRDDEIHAQVDLDPIFWPGPPGTFGPGERIGVTLSLRSNYYVYCLSTVVATRLLLDFNYDACLLVRDPNAFVARVEQATASRLKHWLFRSEEVQYYDPLDISPAEVQICNWKHSRYAYQREHRLWWIPPNHVSELPHLDIEVGNLSDIAEVLEPTRVDIENGGTL
jgi:hypothetical protein